MPKSTVKAATQLAVIVLLFGLAECAAGSCLSYGHSCWGAHGKRSGGGSVGVGVGVDAANSAVAAALQQASPEDTRWFLSRLLANKPPGPPPKTRGGADYKMWQRFDVNVKDDAELSSEMRDSPISRAGVMRLDTEDEDFRAGGEETQDSGPEGEELLVMASPADVPEVNRGAQKLRLFKIMNRASSKNIRK